MENDFVKVDLHIHTPASSCYKGKRSNDEYLRILRQAKAQELKVISFTDHNSIEGYKDLLKLKEQIISEKHSLSLITDSEQTKSRLQILEKDLEIFDDILILPGIEFEVNNGIHLLIIFNDTVTVDQLTKFLIDGGYSPKYFGTEEPSNQSNWDIFTLFEESKKYDCVVIDAHTDSDKGILNTIRQGIPRANCFRSPSLSAVCYKSEEQREKLQYILKTSKEYYRTIPLAFVKFSDSHIADTVGLPSTWIKLEKISFESLKTAFLNASELISTEEPSIIKILDDLIQAPNSFGIPDLSTKSKELISKYTCALSNSEGGYILLGVTPNKGKVGILVKDTSNRDSIKELLDQMIDCLRGVEPSTRLSLNLYPLQDNKLIISIHIPKSSNLVNLKEDGLVYSIKGNSISVLSASDIEYLVEDKVVKEFESKISRRLQSVEKDCHLIKNFFSSLPIIRFFDKNSNEARLNPSLAKSISLSSDDINKLKEKKYDGASRGTLFYLREYGSPRLPYTYLRYTLPLFTILNINRPSLPSATIYAIPGGGVFYCNRDYPFFSERYSQIIKLSKTSIGSKYDMKFITCFLKSSFLLWYMQNKYDDIDLFSPDIFRNIRFPVLNMKNPHTVEIMDSINKDFDIIVKLETTFLIGINKIKEDEEALQYTEKHNSIVNEVAHHIDDSIYKLIGLSDDEISTIENNLRLNGIFVPKVELVT